MLDTQNGHIHVHDAIVRESGVVFNIEKDHLWWMVGEVDFFYFDGFSKPNVRFVLEYRQDRHESAT